MGSSLGQFFRGLKRSTAQQQGKGEGGKIQVGQYDRYTKTFNALLSDDPEVVAELQRRGLKPDDLGSHSARKGATTFASSGSTACPPQAAINLRGGWSMPGVQSTYVRYEAAGDQFCGRTLAGLPNDRPEFAILPPHFEHNQEANLAECFPGAPASLFRVLEFALASVVFHRQYLRDILPAKHRLFQTPLFTRPVVLEELAADVICGIASAEDSMRPTGVPPYIALLDSLETVREEVKSVRANLVGDVVSGVAQILEERAIGAATVTRHGLSEMLTDVFQSSPLYESLSSFLKLQNGSANTNSSSSSSNGHSRRPITPYAWGGRFHLVPQDFSLPDGSALLAWQHYLCGDESHGYPPLKVVPPDDMPNKNLRKRLSDFKFLMRFFEERVKAGDRWIDNPSVAQANAMFAVAAASLDLNGTDTESSNKRSSQAKWLTLVKHLRVNKKRRANEESDG